VPTTFAAAARAGSLPARMTSPHAPEMADRIDTPTGRGNGARIEQVADHVPCAPEVRSVVLYEVVHHDIVPRLQQVFRDMTAEKPRGSRHQHLHGLSCSTTTAERCPRPEFPFLTPRPDRPLSRSQACT
jgi:hypothetical protein